MNYYYFDRHYDFIHSPSNGKSSHDDVTHRKCIEYDTLSTFEKFFFLLLSKFGIWIKFDSMKKKKKKITCNYYTSRYTGKNNKSNKYIYNALNYICNDLFSLDEL